MAALGNGLSPISTKTFEYTQHTDYKRAIGDYVLSQLRRFQLQRQVIEEYWKECWALYLGTPEALEELRNMVLHTVGDVESDWRHRINVGKAYESAEQIHGYLMQATFPNKDFFGLMAKVPTARGLERVVRRYLTDLFDDTMFREHYSDFLRQLIITGNSVLALPWRLEVMPMKKKVVRRDFNPASYSSLDNTFETVEEEVTVYNGPQFETLDMFDCYFDVTVKNSNESPFLRRLTKTRADIIECINSNYYDSDVAMSAIRHAPTLYKADESGKFRDRLFGTFESPYDYSLGDLVQLWEYWGDIHLQGKTLRNMVVTVLDDGTVLRCEPNPYWCGRPFIIGTYTPILQTYGMGAIQPNTGLLHELNIITNQRLDNLELGVDNMWTLLNSSTLQPNEVFSAPGRVFLVNDHADLQPVTPATNSQVITYNEAGYLEGNIDKNFGTIAGVGSASPRDAERVTAQEILSMREAGGNRLSNVHRHIESSALTPLLGKVLKLTQQFIDDDRMVSLPSREDPEVLEYYLIGPGELNLDWVLKPTGSDYVVERKRKVQLILDFLATTTQVPQFAEKINYEKILMDLVYNFGLDDPESYIKMPEQQQPELPEEGEQPLTGEQEIEKQLYELGGKPLQQAVSNDMAAMPMEAVASKYLPTEKPTMEEPQNATTEF